MFAYLPILQTRFHLFLSKCEQYSLLPLELDTHPSNSTWRLSCTHFFSFETTFWPKAIWDHLITVYEKIQWGACLPEWSKGSGLGPDVLSHSRVQTPQHALFLSQFAFILPERWFVDWSSFNVKFGLFRLCCLAWLIVSLENWKSFNKRGKRYPGTAVAQRCMILLTLDTLGHMCRLTYCNVFYRAGLGWTSTQQWESRILTIRL